MHLQVAFLTHTCTFCQSVYLQLAKVAILNWKPQFGNTVSPRFSFATFGDAFILAMTSPMSCLNDQHHCINMPTKDVHNSFFQSRTPPLPQPINTRNLFLPNVIDRKHNHRSFKEVHSCHLFFFTYISQVFTPPPPPAQINQLVIRSEEMKLRISLERWVFF